ncbi:hypothetical protein BDR26DRAFT_866198 [Obelidium mucronatum]|nr:hypothetical protein BDR26DRAFT_866198 [Obelidium mucronatum]
MSQSISTPVGIRKLVSIAGSLVLPSLITLGAKNTWYEAAFRSTPANDNYYGMFITIMIGLSIVNTRLLFSLSRSAVESPDWIHPLNALDLFEIFLFLLLSILNFVGGMWGAGIAWTLYLSVLVVCHMRLAKSGALTIRSQSPSPSNSYRIALAVLYVLLAIGFFAFPVFQSWDLPQAFIRWYEYTISGELLWRGIFAAHACGFIYCLLDPWRRHIGFVMFVAVSCVMHATFMLMLWGLTTDSRNKNPEHVWSEIPAFYFIGVYSGSLVALVARRESLKKLEVETQA